MVDLQAFARTLTPEREAEVDQQLRRIAFGVEQAGDISSLVDQIQQAAAHAPKQQPRPIAAQEASPQPPAGPSKPTHEGMGQARAPLPSVAKPAAGLASDLLSLLRRNGMHVYAKSGALKIELGVLRSGETSGAPQYTVQLDAAHSIGTHYDWVSKIPFQFTARELPQLAAFLLGFSGKRLTFANHGPSADKQLAIEEQPGKLFVTVSRTGARTVAVPVSGPDVFTWGELCLVALSLNRPEVGREGHMALLRRMATVGAAQ